MLDAAARFLEARPRSVGEVRRRLLTAGYTEVLVEGAIARLVDLGILDDEAFARAWVESRDRAHPRGVRALRGELRLKGLDPATIESVLAARASGMAGPEADPGAAAQGDPDADAARRLLERSVRTLARVAEPRRRRERAYALLVRHGFDAETCRVAIGAWLAADDD